MKRVIISEGKIKQLFIITESQESKSISQAKKLAMERLNIDEKEADNLIRISMRNDLPVLRTPNGGKFILGVTRMYCDQELNNAQVINQLNSTLKLVASDAHINEYDRNLNGLSAQDLINRFAKAMSDNFEAEKENVNSMTFDTPSNYEIVRIDSFDDATKFSKYTDWCITHSKKMFYSYTNNGINQFYFCLRNGFENVVKEPTDGCPLDEYGLSMLAVCVDENGRLNTCTCRWNHDNGGNDAIMNTAQISKVIGMNFFNTFKPNNVWNEALSNALRLLADGKPIEDVFDVYYGFHEGFAVVELKGRRNFINTQGEILSKTWFDSCYDFHEGFARVQLNNMCNFINIHGEIISKTWFDSCYGFHEGFAVVQLNKKCNFITKQCEILSQTWFDECHNFHEGFAAVELKGKSNFIDKQGEILSQAWFDTCYDFHEGFAPVQRSDNEWNFINRKGEILSQTWFDNFNDFNNGFAPVQLNNKWNFINIHGEIISQAWFDDCGEFHEGFGRVELNKKWNYINTQGEILSKTWFDLCGQFHENFAFVWIDGQRYRIDRSGHIY